MRLLTPEFLHNILQVSAPEIQRIQSLGQTGFFSIDNNKVARSYYDDKYGILSLSESPTNLLMWAHYADSHRGFVIQLDTSHEFFKSPLFGQVEYSDNRPILSPTNIDSVDVFYRKSSVWGPEREWRFIKLLSEARKKLESESYPKYLFDFPLEVVSGIVFGVNMPEVRKAELIDLCTKNQTLEHIKIFHAQLDKNLFEVNIYPPIDGSKDPLFGVGRACSAR